MTVTNPLMIAITAAVLLTLSPAAFARDDWHHGDGWHHDRHDIWRHGDRRQFGYDNLGGNGYVDPIYPYSYPDGAEPIYPYDEQPADVDPAPFQSPSDPPPFSPWVDPPPFFAPAQ